MLLTNLLAPTTENRRLALLTVLAFIALC